MTYTGTLVGGDGNGGNVVSFTLTWPTVAANDLALIFWSHNSTTAFNAETTKPSGFTAVDSQSDGNELLGLWSKVCTGTESGTITFNVSGGTARTSAVLVVVRGYSGIHLNTKAADTGTDANHTAPSITPTIADVGVIIANGERTTTGSTSMTPPAGYTVAQQFGTGGTAGYYTGAAYEGSAGNITGTHTASVAISPGTMVNSASAADVAVMTVALTPRVTSRTITPGTTTNVGVALGRQKSKTLGPGLTTNVGVALGRTKSKTPSAIASTNTAVALTPTKSKGLTPATEADSAVALTKTDRIESGVTPPTETDTAVVLGRTESKTVAPSTETDNPGAGYGEGGYGEGAYGGGLVRTKARTLTPAAETDTAQTVGHRKTKALTPATETDAAVTVTRLAITRVDLTPATETDTGRPLGRTRARTLTPAAETDGVVTIGHLKLRPFNPATETDTAVAVGRHRSTGLAPATETDTGLTLGKTHLWTLTPGTETDTVVTLHRVKTSGITAAGETDEATALVLVTYAPTDLTLTGALYRAWRGTLEQTRDAELAERTTRGTLERDRDAELHRAWKAHLTP